MSHSCHYRWSAFTTWWRNNTGPAHNLHWRQNAVWVMIILNSSTFKYFKFKGFAVPPRWHLEKHVCYFIKLFKYTLWHFCLITQLYFPSIQSDWLNSKKERNPSFADGHDLLPLITVFYYIRVKKEKELLRAASWCRLCSEQRSTADETPQDSNLSAPFPVGG